MITKIEDYFSMGCGRCARFGTPDCSTRLWHHGLQALREICLSVDLDETVKWGHPCYMQADRNIAIIGALRGGFRLGFFNAALMTDPHNVLERQGPNTRHADSIRFASNDRVAGMDGIIRSYLQEAMSYAAKDLKPPRDVSEPDLPDELAEALDSDPELSEAFYKLTPGRRKSYIININSAKRSDTRIRRIEGFRDNILAGRGAMER